MITGETGAGKEMAARLLHRLSARAAAPFMAVNCAAIPADLLESEIFGHEKGAFTGAQQRHLGYAERAGQGTLFLDEIGDMSPSLQAKLLQADRRRQLSPGRRRSRQSPSTPGSSSATHRYLAQRDVPTPFREDLYFRLAVLTVEIPPLRLRPEDISILIDRFLQNAVARLDLRLRGLSALAEEAALAYPWPGNIRELRNRVERAAALATNEWIMPGDLFPEQFGRSTAEDFVPLSVVRDAAEKRQIERALGRTAGQMGKAANLLGISRTTLWEKMTRFGMTEAGRSDF